MYTGKKILLIEDDLDISKIITYRLEKEKYQTLVSYDGKNGIQTVREESPDLILLDLNIPVISGYDVCRKIKKDKELKSIPVIILSASGLEASEKSMKCGADDYLLKPFEMEELLKMIEKHLK